MRHAAFTALAALWLAAAGAAAQATFEVPVTFNGTSKSDVDALYALRGSLTGVPPDWVTSAEPCGAPACGPMLSTKCAWTGLACNGSRVVAVWLPCTKDWCYNLGGSLAPGLAGATKLQLLEFQGNTIGGSLPPEWATLKELAVLSAGYNALSGTLPPAYGNLTALQHLRLNGNHIRGGLPPSWGALERLSELLVGSNAMGGGFPPEWATLGSAQILVFEGNDFSGSLPSSWARMLSLQVLDVRGMCGVCGAVPFNQVVRLGVSGSSLGWPCGSGNCSGLPLGFLGQAVIIVSILLVLTSLCLWRRVWLFRRHGRAGQRSGLGLMRAAMSSRAPRPPRPNDEANANEAAAAPAPPPVVVLQPDMQFCTARMDAEFAAALAAAESGEQALKAGEEPAAAPPRRRWLGWLGGGQQGASQQVQPAEGAGAGGGAPASLELAVTQQQEAYQPQQQPGSSVDGSHSTASSQAAQEAPAATSPPPLPLLPGARRSLEPGVVGPPAPPGAGPSVRVRSASGMQHVSREEALEFIAAQRYGHVDRRSSGSVREMPRRPIPMYDVDLLEEGPGGSASANAVAASTADAPASSGAAPDPDSVQALQPRRPAPAAPGSPGTDAPRG